MIHDYQFINIVYLFIYLFISINLAFVRLTFDAMHAVTGAYAKPIFVDKLGATLVCLSSINV